MYVAVDEVNTSARNAGSAARSPACCANTFAHTPMSGHTTVCTVTSPLRQKVRTVSVQSHILSTKNVLENTFELFIYSFIYLSGIMQ